eukprot:m.259532 g.259532  ORF g.259532 m.259532 type:complete len:348 (+) comp38230_c0_seq1:134-1177(+)
MEEVSMEPETIDTTPPQSDLMSQFKGRHTLFRQAMLVNHGAKDYGGSVVIKKQATFDINETIFKTLEGTMQRAVIASKLAIDLYWDDATASKIAKGYASIPMHLDHDKNLLDFMQNECDFVLEHAEGSFMDHLQFVYDYGKNYYKEKSPRVLLLHSIMGVATNIFPMDVSKEDKLRAMLTEDEMIHIEAFPSVLRLILHWHFIEELKSCSDEKLQTIKSISFHRCIDNKRISMTADDLWAQLNFHLVHFLDFLPAANWKLTAGEITFCAFCELHTLLTRAGKLVAKVDLDLKQSGYSAAPFGLSTIVYNLLPSETLRKQASKGSEKFSQKIGHSLDYQIDYEPRAGL